MRAVRVPIDSDVLGANVLSIEDFSRDAGFAAFESAYVAEHRPLYVSCKIPMDRVADIHALESNGFHLIECQLRTQLDLAKSQDISRFPYLFERVRTEEGLAAVLEIAGATFEHDRFSIDPLVGRELSGERYRRYVRRSFELDDEAVYRLFDPASNKTAAFKTHRYLGNDEVLLLLGGVHPDFKTSGAGVINTYAELHELRRLGIKRGTTHISAANYAVFNLEVGKLGFRVLGTFAVLRKIYA